MILPQLTPSPEDRAVTERIITRFYQRLARPAPGFLWFEDPIAASLACNLLDRLRATDDWPQLEPIAIPVKFKRPRGGRIAPALWSRLDWQLRSSLVSYADAARNAGASLHAYRAWSFLWCQLGALFGRQLAARLQRGVELKAAVRDWRFAARGAAFVDGYWGGTPEDGMGRPVVAETRATQLDALQQACGWWCPRGRVVVCALPAQRIRVDRDFNLHSETGPALEWSGEHAAHYWHGTQVPAHWIEQRDSLDPKLALYLQDPAQRHIVATLVGWTRALAGVAMWTVDADPDPQIGTLLEYELPHDGLVRFLRVTCGTGREFMLSVPRFLATARAANAWTYGLAASDYQLEVRT